MGGIDTSQVDRLAKDFERAPRRIKREARRTMKRTALEIKRGMKQDFSGHSHAPRVKFSLEFENVVADGRFREGGLAYEIGELDSAGPQWGLAAILAFGTSNNAPVLDHTAALRRETPAMLEHLGINAEASVFGDEE